MRWLTGWINNTLSSGIVAVADAAADDLTALGTHPDKIRVIINGAEPLKKLSDDERRAARMALGFSDNDFVVGMFARLEECKGHKYLFEAVSKMGKDSRIKILLCGRGSLDDELHRLAASLGISDRVVFAGFCPDISPYMNAVDLNVNCSIGTETSSLALSEGMSIGRAAVVSDYGGNGAMVENDVSGVVVPRANADALTAALTELENDRERLSRMSEAALRRYNERFTPQPMTRELEEFDFDQLDGVDKKRKSTVKKVDA
jgi:glycosyltransferase involved in cell wall biosynthesis